MKSFTDNADRTWTIGINVDAIKRVRGLLEVDLLDAVSGGLVERLIRDPILLCDVIYAVCKPQAEDLAVTDEDFGRAMAGDAIEQATKALLEELVSFSPSPRDRAILRRVLETTWTVMEKARDLIETRLADGELERTAEQALAPLRNSSGDSQASPASIRGP